MVAIIPEPMSRYALIILACLTLGLSPFFPEPHLVGKVRWVLGGAVGMAPMDWFDLALHGSPWVLLLGMALQDGWRWLRARR